MPALVWTGGQYVTLGTGVTYSPSPMLAHDWSETNRAWAYTSENDWLDNLPLGNNTIVPLQRNSSLSFKQNVTNTVNANAGRVVIDLRNETGAAETFHLDSFVKAGTGTQETYAFGLYVPRLAGFIGHGPDKTTIQMDANSMTQVQLDEMKTMTKASFAPLGMGCIRIDGTTTSGNSVLLGGVRFVAEDQNLLTEVAADMTDQNPSWEVPVFTPQPAPHNGLVIYPNATVFMSHCLFEGFGRAIISQPPFECTNFITQYSYVRIYHCEFDGRRAADIDPARPRRCNPIMLNNEYLHLLQDSYVHHSNVSRYAANDENRDTAGQYTLRRVKAEHMTDNGNTDPALNNGEPLGGWSPVTPFGWESSRATITIEDSIVHQGITGTLNGQAPAHFQMTTVGGVNPQGGRMSITGTRWHNEGYPDIDEFLILRIGATTYWRSDGYANTIEARHPDGQLLTAYEYTGTWPPTKAGLASVGVTPATHYIVKLA